ncbi:hypothetical protein SAMN05660242_2701 [Thermoanaerobacterium sp. RBIITD]|nr:hypothetical protein SAMN05660242_2701 [Thermoanaerobacterium sp. RBIITD]
MGNTVEIYSFYLYLGGSRMEVKEAGKEDIKKYAFYYKNFLNLKKIFHQIMISKGMNWK